MRIFRRYFIDLLKYNLMVSVPGGLFGTSMGRSFAEYFLMSFVTVGLLGSIYLYRYFKADEYFFYYNKGMGKLRLNLFAGAADLLLGFAGFGILHLLAAT
jgi:hypothetical protein